MKYLKNYYIFERKQIGNLYHIFDLNKLSYMLKKDKLSSYKFHNISTTRSKNMNYYTGDSSTSIFKFELDGDKLSDRYKIKPYQYKTFSGGYLTEYEEVIKTQDIENISKYVKKFIIIKSKVESLKNSGFFNSDGGYFNSDKRNLPAIFRENIIKIRDMFGDIWIQDGTQIIKDDEWLNSILDYPINEIKHAYALFWRGMKKKNNNKYTYYIDDIIPLDKRNKGIEELVLGHEYYDLYLYKSNIFENLPEPIYNYDLYIFDFRYKDFSEENIIEDNDKYIHIKKAKLKNVEVILSKKI